MTIREFTEAYGELCDAMEVFLDKMHREPTLEARNVTYHRDRLLDCLEEWHRARPAASDHAGGS